METKFYDGTKLLSMTDLDGEKPEIYLCTSNRSAGKTTYFNRMAFQRWLKGKGEFLLLYRYNYELGDVATKFFGDIGRLFFTNYYMAQKPMAKGKFMVIGLTDGDSEKAEITDICGYAVCLNDADAIKKFSHVFANVEYIIFDEFQSETNHYCTNEIAKFVSIHQSIARGGGKQSRYVPVYMLGNYVSLLNPYYLKLGISSRIQSNTKFLRGIGWVLEQGYNKHAAEALKESRFNMAFSDTLYMQYSTQQVYLNDSLNFVEKPKERLNYFATMIVNGVSYGIGEGYDTGMMYCVKFVQENFPIRLTISISDHDTSTRLVGRNSHLLITMRSYYENGLMRFQNLECKQACLDALAY